MKETLLEIARKHYSEMPPHVQSRKTAVLLKCLIEQNSFLMAERESIKDRLFGTIFTLPKLMDVTGRVCFSKGDVRSAINNVLDRDITKHHKWCNCSICECK